MTSIDFASAQQRVLQRQQAAAAALGAQDEALAHRSSGLPQPFSRLGASTLGLWNQIRGREGTQPALRVGQLDAALLDEELLELFRGQISDGLKFLSPHINHDYSAEILLVLRAILFKLSVWDHDASYGAALQGLKYVDARHSNAHRHRPTRWQKGLYGVCSIGGRYAWTRWEAWLISRQAETGSNDDRLDQLKVWTDRLSTAHATASVVSFLAFLVTGAHRTILDRIFRLRLIVPPSADGPTRHALSFEYLNRQLVWHAFTEFLLFLLPLLGISHWRRWLAKSWRRLRAMWLGKAAVDADQPQGEFHFLPERTCALCFQEQFPAGDTSEAALLAASGAGLGGVTGSVATDITNPYAAGPCGCVYCYLCLQRRLAAEEGEGFACLRCSQWVRTSTPWHGDVVIPEVIEPRGPTSDIGLDQSSAEWVANTPKAVTFADEHSVAAAEPKAEKPSEGNSESEEEP